MSVALSAQDITRALTRISHEILERNQGSSNIVLLGIPTRGAHIAGRISAMISAIEGNEVPTGTLDITLFRDDLRMRPPRAIMPTKIPTSGIEGKDVILVDDVLFSGRTIRAALDALGEIGRPRTVQLAALVAAAFTAVIDSVEPLRAWVKNRAIASAIPSYSIPAALTETEPETNL